MRFKVACLIFIPLTVRSTLGVDCGFFFLNIMQFVLSKLSVVWINFMLTCEFIN